MPDGGTAPLSGALCRRGVPRSAGVAVRPERAVLARRPSSSVRRRLPPRRAVRGCRGRESGPGARVARGVRRTHRSGPRDGRARCRRSHHPGSAHGPWPPRTCGDRARKRARQRRDRVRACPAALPAARARTAHATAGRRAVVVRTGGWASRLHARQWGKAANGRLPQGDRPSPSIPPGQRNSVRCDEPVQRSHVPAAGIAQQADRN